MTKNPSMQHSAPQTPASFLPVATAWALRAWPPLLWQATEPAHVRFHHLGTRITLVGDAQGGIAGQTVWAAQAGDGEAGMAWDWVQLARGVVAIADPMSVVTNVRLVSEEGEVLTSVQAARYLNEIVRGLPWQEEVQRALGQQLN
jgi:hypothetical protein